MIRRKNRVLRAGLPALFLLLVIIVVITVVFEKTPTITPSTPGFRVVETTATSVHDGDTFRADVAGTSESIRVIGVDTPELDSSDAEEASAAAAARNYTSSLLLGQKVWLVIDEAGERDRYDRLLTYVWLNAPPASLEEMREAVLTDTLNGLLLTSGHAVPMTIEPNTSFAYEFEHASALG